MESAARKFLQHRVTRLYLAEGGKFTDKLEEAVQIQTVTEALSYCRQYQLKSMDILMRFGREEYDIRLELGDPPPLSD